jgi:hypothetical protein
LRAPTYRALKMSTPFFSIAIPTYGYNGRGCKFLDFSLDIISKQTFVDFEVILSDRPYHPRWNDRIWTGNNTMGCPSGMTIKNKNLIFFNEQLNWLMDVDYYKRMFDLHGEPEILDEITVVNRTWGNRLTDTLPQGLKDKELDMLILEYA